MSSQYDRIDEVSQEHTSIMAKVLDKLKIKRTETIENSPIDDRISERLSESSTSIYSESFQLKKEMWKKKKTMLIVIGSVIVFVIIIFTILILEPWKKK